MEELKTSLRWWQEGALTQSPGLASPPSPVPRIPASGTPLCSPDLVASLPSRLPRSKSFFCLPPGNLGLVTNHSMPWGNESLYLVR